MDSNSLQLKQQIEMSFDKDISSSKPNIQMISQNDIDLQFQQEHMNEMDKFDVKQIYSNKDIYELNKFRSGFVFILPIIKRGKRHLFSIQKKQIFWTIIKFISLVIICYYIFQWVDQKSNIHSTIKSILLWTIKLMPFIFLVVMTLDPGYVLDHQIYQKQYESTDDKKRPKQGKYCQYCKLFVKRKTTHCFRCHHCVCSFDHHCGIMVRCVGKNNCFLFYGFVILANTLYMGLIALVFYQWVLT